MPATISTYKFDKANCVLTQVSGPQDASFHNLVAVFESIGWKVVVDPNQHPGDSWGSREKVKAWLTKPPVYDKSNNIFNL